MRTIAIASLALVVAACASAGVDASLTPRSHPQSKRMQAHAALARRGAAKTTASGQAPAPAPAPSHGSSSHNGSGPDYGLVYGLVDRLGIAVAMKNWTMAADLIDDDAFIYVDTVSCEGLTKTQFLSVLAEQPELTTFFQLQGWAGFFNGTSALFQATIGTVFGPNAGAMANRSEWLSNVGIFASTNVDGTKLSIFEEWIDKSYAQANNKTQMMAVYDDITIASQIKDISVFERLLNDDVLYTRATAWDQVPMVQLPNKTAVLAEITNGWSHVSQATIKTVDAFPVCNFVVSWFLWSGVFNEGGAAMNKFGFALMLDENFKIAQITEYVMTPWL